MSALPNTPSQQVLKNRGIPVLVHQVEPDANGVRYNRVYESDADDAAPKLETLFVRLTALGMSDIEDRWGDMEVWEEALESKPYLTLIDTLAIIWECTRQEAGKRLIDDNVDDYSTAVGAAVLMANGVEGDAVVRVLKTGVSSSKRLRARIAEDGTKAVAELEAEEAKEAEKAANPPAVAAPVTPTNPNPETPSPSYSNIGVDSDAQLTSSGV